MHFFRDIDADQTEKNVIDFFSKYYERLCVMSGVNLKSPALSATPSAPSIGNSAENQVTGIMWAREVLAAIYRSIDSCSKDCQKLLTLKFIENNEQWKVQNALNVGKDKYYYLRSKSCNQFADAYQVQAAPYFEEGESDLHVYKD